MERSNLLNTSLRGARNQIYMRRSNLWIKDDISTYWPIEKTEYLIFELDPIYTKESMSIKIKFIHDLAHNIIVTHWFITKNAHQY